MSTPRLRLLTAVILAFALVASACESKSDEGEKEGAAEEEAPAGPPEGWVETEIAELGIKGMLPEGAAPSTMGKGLMYVEMDVSMMLGPADDDTPATAAEATKKASDEGGTEVETEILDNGWVVTWERANGESTQYGMLGRVDVGDATFECQTDVAYETLRDGAVEVCRYLMP